MGNGAGGVTRGQHERSPGDLSRNQTAFLIPKAAELNPRRLPVGRLCQHDKTADLPPKIRRRQITHLPPKSAQTTNPCQELFRINFCQERKGNTTPQTTKTGQSPAKNPQTTNPCQELFMISFCQERKVNTTTQTTKTDDNEINRFPPKDCRP
ncbi:hypothetical protein Bbelb_338800 [Branchiostoma belcheri]|nr:hypothetical protein Bbelb_338800 [Branchiostoma belcheri]